MITDTEYYTRDMFDMSTMAVKNCCDDWYEELEKLEDVSNMNYAVFIVKGHGYTATQLIASFIEEVEAIDFCMLYPRTHCLLSDKLTVVDIQDATDIPF